MNESNGYKPVLTKRDFVRRYRRGEFGNRAPTWDTIAEFQAARYRGDLVHIRNRIAGGPTWYNVPTNEVNHRYIELIKGGAKPGDLYFSAMAPHESHGTIQGEVQQRQDSLHVDLSVWSARLPMRDAINQGLGYRTLNGTFAALLLRHYMDPASYDWLQVLFDRYPGHVIEFSCFDIPWGTIPNRNTVIWEVRLY